jgi:hypothetical protein
VSEPSDGYAEHERLQRRLDRSVIAGPLLDRVSAEQGLEGTEGEPRTVAVVIDLNFDYVDGRDAAAARIRELIEQAVSEAGTPGVEQGRVQARPGGQYVVTSLELGVIQRLVSLDAAALTFGQQTIFHVWPDFDVHPLINRSNATVKADAARASFAAAGRDVVWAVLDSGVDADHVHFKKHQNLVLAPPLEHLDFTGQSDATKDSYGHGTHVARPPTRRCLSPSSPGWRRSARSSATRSWTTAATAARARSSPPWTRSSRSTTTDAR